LGIVDLILVVVILLGINVLQDVVEGTVLIITPTSITHQGVRLIATGTIMLQLSARQVGVFEALYSSVKPIQLM
jgi:hypothetical protein